MIAGNGCCKAGAFPCPKQRDRVLVVDRIGHVTFFGPSTHGVTDIVGSTVCDLVQSVDRDYVREKLQKVLHEGETVSWLIRDVWGHRIWHTIVEGETKGASEPYAVAVTRPVCPLLLQLTTRQRHILREFVNTGCAKQVAAQLDIKAATVHTHLYRSQIAARRSDQNELLTWACDMRHALDIEDEIQAYHSRRQG